MGVALTGPDSLTCEIAAVEAVMAYSMGTLPGVAVVHVAGLNGEGLGLLSYRVDGMLLWRAPGSGTFGTPVLVTGGGAFLVKDGENADKYLRVNVTAAKLPAFAWSVQVSIQRAADNGVGGADVDAAGAAVGDVQTFLLTIRNQSSKGASLVRAWLTAATSGYEISADGVSWSAPTSKATAVVLSNGGSIVAGGSADLHVRRSVSAGAGADPAMLSEFAVSFNAIP